MKSVLMDGFLKTVPNHMDFEFVKEAQPTKLADLASIMRGDALLVLDPCGRLQKFTAVEYMVIEADYEPFDDLVHARRLKFSDLDASGWVLPKHQNDALTMFPAWLSAAWILLLVAILLETTSGNAGSLLNASLLAAHLILSALDIPARRRAWLKDRAGTDLMYVPS